MPRKMKNKAQRTPQKVQNIHKCQAHSSYQKDGCEDEVKLFLDIENDKVASSVIKASTSSCHGVKHAVDILSQHIKGKHIGDIYKISAEQLAEKNRLNHGAEMVIYVLRQAILYYESKKATSSLKEIMNLLEDYDKDLPPRDLKNDYEY